MDDLHLTDSLRSRLQRPLGKLIPDFKVDNFLFSLPTSMMLITVGDRTTRRCEEAGMKPSLEIIDFKEKRGEAPPVGTEVDTVRATNPPGTITQESISAIQKLLASEGRHRLVIDGEEDLLVLPCAYFAKPGSMILYGQPNVGLVAVTVDEEVRLNAERIMKEMGWSGVT